MYLCIFIIYCSIRIIHVCSIWRISYRHFLGTIALGDSELVSFGHVRPPWRSASGNESSGRDTTEGGHASALRLSVPLCH